MTIEYSVQDFSLSSPAHAAIIAEASAHQDKSRPIRGETALWRAVITQALMDAANHSGKEEARNDRMLALRWLCSNSRDFRTICYYAGYDPAYIRQRITEALKRDCRWRASRESRGAGATV